MTRGSLWYAVKSLRRTPGSTVVSIGLLAFGLGANATVFSVVERGLLQPLPFPDPDRIVRIWSSRADRNLPFFSVSIPDYLDWKARARSFETLAAYERQRTISIGTDAEPLSVARVTPDVFEVLGVSPVLGRLFTPDRGLNLESSALISHAFWNRRFGGRDDVLGRTLTFDERSWTIIGVMPPRFEIPNAPCDVWVALPLAPGEHDRSRRVLRVLGRMRTGTRVDDSRRDLGGVARQLEREHPATNSLWSITIRPLNDTVVPPETRRSVLLLQGAVVLVLVMACANIAGLLLGRATTRRLELAVRTALGASRRALMHMLLVESAVLAAVGGVLGTLLALISMALLKTMAEVSLPALAYVALSARVLAVTGGCTAAAAILCGLAPALYTTHAAPDALRARHPVADRESGRARSALIVAQMAVAVTLLVGAVLMITSLIRLQTRDLGIDSTSLVVAQLAPPRSATETGATSATDSILAGLASLPGVHAVAAANSLPFMGPNTGNVFVIESQPRDPGEPRPDSDVRIVTPGYFRTLGIPVLRGRSFIDSDRSGAAVAVISASAAKQYWRHAEPIGTRIQLGSPAWLTIVGVVGDARYQAAGEPGSRTRPMIYVLHGQTPEVPLAIAVRTATDPTALIPSVRRALQRAAPGFAVTQLETMESVLASAWAPQRFATTLLGSFAWAAVAIALAGVYGLITYAVGRRTKELGVRLALGASSFHIIRVTAGQGVALTVLGVTLGMLGAWALAGTLRSVLFEVSSTDPLTYLAVSLVFLAVSTTASYLPARKALRINPVDSLRCE